MDFGEVKIPVEGGEIVAFTYRPKEKEGKNALLVNFHGEYFVESVFVDIDI